MKIVINTLAAAGIETGGGFTILANLIPWLITSDRSNDYCLIVSQKNQTAFQVGEPNVSYIVLPTWVHRNPLRVIADNAIVPLLVRRHKPDVFFSPNDYLPPWLSCPSVVGAFNLLYYQPAEALLWDTSSRAERWHRRARQLYYRTVTPRSLLRANKVIAISEETRRVIVKHIAGLSQDDVAVVYPGVPAALIGLKNTNWKGTAEEEQQPEAPFFLSTSAISPYKNFDLLIRAFAIFCDRYASKHRLVIVGRSYYPSYGKELELLAAQLGVGDRVEMRGFVPLHELASLYESAGAFVLLSSCESFGFPALEAMAFGTPVIVSDQSSLKEIVGPGGLTVDPHNIESVASELQRVVCDHALRDSMVAYGKKRAQEFSWEEAANALGTIFQSVSLGEGPRALTPLDAE